MFNTFSLNMLLINHIKVENINFTLCFKVQNLNEEIKFRGK